MTSIEILLMLLRTLAYDSANDKCRSGDAGACVVNRMMVSDWIVFFGTSAFSGVILVMNWQMWLQGMNDSIEEIEQAEKDAALEEEANQEVEEEILEGDDSLAEEEGEEVIIDEEGIEDITTISEEEAFAGETGETQEPLLD